MEQRIMDVLRRMQPILGDEELRELKNVLHIVFGRVATSHRIQRYSVWTIPGGLTWKIT